MAKPSSRRSASDVDPFDTALMDHTPRASVWSSQFPVPSAGAGGSVADDSLRTLAMRPRYRARSWVWRPALIIRVLWLLILLMLATLTMFTGVLAHVVAGLSDRIREQEVRSEVPLQEPLPTSERLLDDEAFASILAAKPHQRSSLLLARAQHLLGAERSDEATAIIDDMLRPTRLQRLSPDRLLQLIELSMQLGRHQVAYQHLQMLSMQDWSPEQRRRAMALLGRLHMTLAPTPES